MAQARGDLSENVLAFAHHLRGRHGFLVGPAEAHDALRALEVVDLRDLTQVRQALRTVLSATREQDRAFDALFDQFFLPKVRGLPQASQPSPNDKAVTTRQGPPKRGAGHEGAGEDDGERPPPTDRRPDLDDAQDKADDGGGRPFLRARYSTQAVEGEPPRLRLEGLPEMLTVASQLVARLSLGRSRAWRAKVRGRRLDFRRTLRASLASGGEALHPHWQGHPRRNPRFVLILDGSRSMANATALMLQFALALTLRARRVEVFFFSTELRRVTPELRRLARAGRGGALPSAGAAWGGGTRIGESLARLVRAHGGVLTPDTVVFVLSDGLDVGEPELLSRALHEISRRTAHVAWLNPLLGSPGYEPSARGMRAALPHLDTFAGAGNLAAFRALIGRIRLRG